MPATTYDLRSDTVTQPSPAMKGAMVEAPLGDDVLGDDPTVKRLEAMIAERTGKEAGLFFPSGTQANETAVNVHAPPGTEILVERRAHIYNYESGGPAVLSGVQVQPIDTEHGIFEVADLDSRIRPVDPHCAQTRLLCLENTHNGHGGRIYPIEDMETVSKWARGRGLAVHLDGARLFNAAVASGIPVERYAACADTVSLCLSKGLGAPVGTCLVGDRETIGRARWIRKRLGGGMRQAGILAAAGVYALEHNVERLAEDHATAHGIAESVSEVEGLEVDLEGVQTNIVMIGITSDGVDAEDFVEALEREGVRVLPVGPRKVRAVTHLDVPPDAAEEVPKRFSRALAGLSSGSRALETGRLTSAS
jgi:threonine aldolase